MQGNFVYIFSAVTIVAHNRAGLNKLSVATSFKLSMHKQLTNLTHYTNKI